MTKTGAVSGLPFGATGMSGEPSANDRYAQRVDMLVGGVGDSVELSPGPHEKNKKSFMGAVKDMGQGILNGAVNSVKSLFTVKGAAMALGTAGLVAALGAPVIMPFLIAGGAIAGGSQILGGLTKGDWNKVGEGIFTLGATGVGAKFGPKEINANGERFSLAKIVKDENGAAQALKPTGILDSVAAYLKAPFRGFGKVEDGKILLNADGKLADSKSILSAAGDRFQSSYASVKQKLDKKATPDAETNTQSLPVSTDQSKGTDRKTQSKVADEDVFYDAVETQSNPEVKAGSDIQAANTAKGETGGSGKKAGVADAQGHVDGSNLDGGTKNAGLFNQDGLGGTFGVQTAISGTMTN